MIFEDSSKMLIARDRDLLSLGLIFGFLVFQDSPQTAAPSPPLTKGEFFTAPLAKGTFSR